MRILAVTPYYSPEGGGLERYAHAVLSRLAGRGHEIQALAFTRNSLPTQSVDGVDVERIVPRLRIGNTPLQMHFQRHAAILMDGFRPDVVVAHTPVPFPAEMAYMAARRRRIPLVVTYHSGQLRGSTRLLDAFAAMDRSTLERRMLSYAERLIAVSPYVRDHALARHQDKVTIVPPGVDAHAFSPKGSASPNRILFVGPLEYSYRWKGVDVLWDAFRFVHAGLPDAELTLVGDGNRFDELTRRASAEGLPIRLVGRVPDDALVYEYRRASVVVLPSTSDAESFGMVLAEANACARPVVGSEIGGIPDFVHDGENGLLAKPGNPFDLAHKIVTILGNPGLANALGAKGRVRVEREHNWERLVERTERVLEEAVASRAPSVALPSPKPRPFEVLPSTPG